MVHDHQEPDALTGPGHARADRPALRVAAAEWRNVDDRDKRHPLSNLPRRMRAHKITIEIRNTSRRKFRVAGLPADA